MSINQNERVDIQALAKLAYRYHYYCDDSWYSCPAHIDGCADESQGDECNCGAEEHNKKINDLLISLKIVED